MPVIVLETNESGKATQVQLPDGTIVNIQR